MAAHCPATKRTAQLFWLRFMTHSFSSRLFYFVGAGSGSSSSCAVTRCHTLSKLSNSIDFTFALYARS